MPRTSAAALEVKALALTPGKRPDPPADMDQAEAAVWKQIVGAMPPDWFTPEMWPLLTVLCANTATYNRVREALKTEEVGSPKFKQLTVIQNTYAIQLARMSTKLKLTAQSRHNINRAKKATKEAVDLQKANRMPWCHRNGEAA